jgi:hypothetical protein
VARSLSFTTAVSAVCVWLTLAPAAHADVQLSLSNGRVTLVAKDATLRQILTEWARVGKLKIVNLERIPGGPLTLELRDVPEGEALDILLRSLSGYIVAPRATQVADASVYDSISVMPTIATPAARTAAAAPPPAPFTPPSAFLPNADDDQNGPQIARPPVFAPGQQVPQPGAPVAVRPVLPVVRPGVVPAQPNNNPNDFQQPPTAAPFPFPNPPTFPAGGQAAPGAIGVSTPGMVAPAPASQPGQIPQPQRPPGD